MSVAINQFTMSRQPLGKRLKGQSINFNASKEDATDGVHHTPLRNSLKAVIALALNFNASEIRSVIMKTIKEGYYLANQPFSFDVKQLFVSKKLIKGHRDNDKMSAVVLLVDDVELSRLKRGEVIEQPLGFDKLDYKGFISTKSKREGV